MGDSTTDLADDSLEVVNVGEVLTASLALCPASHDPSVRIFREFDDRLRVLCERAALEQVFLNLLRNAVESMNARPAKERAIRVAAWRTAQHSILVEISDTGAGIAPQHLTRV